ncbi:cation:proton antiporter [Desulfoluna spongiiphila]|uniref:Sodium/proton antiporter, CPA1 family n=1 Tax=Desulfoluna spongiiphila TaxID=419481 RepID=A0A1G5GHY6_9BACT|nr:sodium:proton antiporter [Desulfoluna spongiiphila]SCY51192.1 sodium/proton antiporter, CPA1 family [Desulfoluna spongiiphila]
MSHDALQTISLSIALGVFSYIISRAYKIPAIVFYLVCGFVFGPAGFNLIRTEEAIGGGIAPMVEIAVAIILFEGGLSLSIQGFRMEKKAIRRLLFITIPITGGAAALLSHYLTGMPWLFAGFFGALIVVTGPTVIGSILKSVALNQRLEILLNWESLWGDVIGVMVSALALELILVSKGGVITAGVFAHLLLGTFVGSLVGLAGGVLLKHIVAWLEKLKDPALSGIASFGGAVALFYISGRIVESSGPLAVVVAGMYLSLKCGDAVVGIRHFKEQIASLFISTLFVLLSAFVNPMELIHLWPTMLAVAFILGAVVRPLAVHLAMAGSDVTLRERWYMGVIGPRGIVAVATASYAAFLLPGFPYEMKVILNQTMAIIFFSGVVATVLCRPLASLLKVRVPHAQTGILLVGSNPMSREFARLLSRHVPVAFLETRRDACSLATDQGFQTVCADMLSADVYEEASREGYDRLVALTRNNALNELVALRAASHMAPGRVYRGVARRAEETLLTGNDNVAHVAFSDGFFITEAVRRMEKGHAWLTEKEADELGDGDIPLARLNGEGKGVLIMRPGIDPSGTLICYSRKEKTAAKVGAP